MTDKAHPEMFTRHIQILGIKGKEHKSWILKHVMEEKRIFSRVALLTELVEYNLWSVFSHLVTFPGFVLTLYYSGPRITPVLQHHGILKGKMTLFTLTTYIYG